MEHTTDCRLEATGGERERGREKERRFNGEKFEESEQERERERDRYNLRCRGENQGLREKEALNIVADGEC